MVQLAWSLFCLDRDGFRTRSFIVRADDFDPNPKGKLSHGIDKERSLREGVHAEEILQEFKSDLTVFHVQILVAHNIDFDEKVLRSESKRLGIDLTKILSLPKLCTMKASASRLQLENSEYKRRLDAYRKNHNMRTRRAKRGYEYYKEVLSDRRHKYPTLRELHSSIFGSVNSDWHDATADVEACERCFRIMAKEGIVSRARLLKEQEEMCLRREKDRIEQEKLRAEAERRRKISAENRRRKNIGTCIGAVAGFPFVGMVGAIIGGVTVEAGIGAVTGFAFGGLV